jgi:hypothetical protein
MQNSQVAHLPNCSLSSNDVQGASAWFSLP